MAYNLTGIVSNSTGVVPFIQGVNTTLMQGWLGNLFLLGFAAILFLAFTRVIANTRKSLMVTSFLSFLVALILRAMNLVPDLTIFITLVLTAITVAFAFNSDL